MGRGCIAAIILLVVGCGNPSPPSGGSDASADAAGGAATTDDSGSAEMEGNVARGTGDASQSGAPDGSDAAGATDAPASDPKTACTRYIQTFCQRAAQCQNLDPSAVTACDAFAALCPDYFFSPGSTRTPSQVEACAADVLAQGCDDFNSGVYLPCQTPGTRKPAEPCGYSSQCETLLCAGGRQGGCGTCAPTAGPGDNCTSGSFACPRDEVCDTTRGTISCVAPALVIRGGGQGAPCGQGQLCDPPLECAVEAGSDAGAGTCQPPTAAGGPCVPMIRSNGAPLCEPYATCNDIGSFQCLKRVPEGQPCDFVPNGDPCVIGTYCDIGDAGTAGFCHANRAAGQPCATEILAGGYRSLGGCMSGVCAGDICAPLPPQPLGIGSACGGDAGACGYALSCANGTCQTTACGATAPDAGTD